MLAPNHEVGMPAGVLLSEVKPMPSPVYDLHYGGGGPDASEARLVVDYDASRLAATATVPTRCAELCDLVTDGLGPLLSISLTVFPFTAKQQLRRDLAAASRLLSPDGRLRVRLTEPRLRLAVRRELETLFGDVEPLGHTGFRCSAPLEHIEAPLADEGSAITHFDALADRTLTFRTLPGLFSFDRLDSGTCVLLDAVAHGFATGASGRILDIGCGYGALGCVLAARGAQVTMLDCDCRAVKLARANLALNGLSGMVVVGNAAAALPTGSFDLVVSNPPTHAGSATLRSLFDLAAGTAPTVLIVVRENLNYEKWMRNRYRFDRVAEGNGYKVIAFARP